MPKMIYKYENDVINVMDIKNLNFAIIPIYLLHMDLVYHYILI